MKNRSWSLTLLCAVFSSLNASQDDPFNMTHAQRVAQENARRIAAAQIKCEEESRKIGDRVMYQYALAIAQKQAEAEKRAARIAARQDVLPEQLLHAFVHPLRMQDRIITDVKPAESALKIDNAVVLAVYSPKVACELSRIPEENNPGYDSPISEFSKMDEYSGVRKNSYANFSVSQGWHSPSSRRSLHTQEEPFQASSERPQDSLVKLACVKKIFCCCCQH